METPKRYIVTHDSKKEKFEHFQDAAQCACEWDANSASGIKLKDTQTGQYVSCNTVQWAPGPGSQELYEQYCDYAEARIIDKLVSKRKK